MDEFTELATAGLVMAFAAVLLVASHFFIEAQSAKQLVKNSIDLTIQTNVIGAGYDPAPDGPVVAIHAFH